MIALPNFLRWSCGDAIKHTHEPPLGAIVDAIVSTIGRDRLPVDPEAIRRAAELLGRAETGFILDHTDDVSAVRLLHCFGLIALVMNRGRAGVMVTLEGCKAIDAARSAELESANAPIVWRISGAGRAPARASRFLLTGARPLGYP